MFDRNRELCAVNQNFAQLININIKTSLDFNILQLLAYRRRCDSQGQAAEQRRWDALQPGLDTGKEWK